MAYARTVGCIFPLNIPFCRLSARTRVLIPRAGNAARTCTRTRTRTRPDALRGSEWTLLPRSLPLASHFPSHRTPSLRFLTKHSRQRLAVLVALRI